MNISIAALSRMYLRGEMSPSELVNASYDRIELAAVNPVWIHVVPREEALARVAELQAGPRGPLFGIPFAVKDNMDVAGLPTTAACPDYGYVAERTAPVVQRLQDAGAILIGKTNMDQFATGLVGTRTPYGACSSVFNAEYISGGSSSGSAVAVASGLVSFSLGTDTAGSGRVPAACNNIVGLKPTRGLLSTRGVVPACRSLDCVSIFALSPADAGVVFDVARRFEGGDPYSREWPVSVPSTPVRLRCGVPGADQLEFFGDAEYAALFASTVETMRELGAEIVEFDLAPFLATAELLYAGPYVAERFAAVGEFVMSHFDSVDPTVGAIISGASKYSAVDVFRAQYKLEALRRTANECWKAMDALILPTAPTAYKIAEVAADPIRLNSNLGTYTNFVNLLDLTAVAVPSGFREDGVPFGVTLIAPAFSDYGLLGIASELQKARAAFAGNHLLTSADFPAYEPPVASGGWVKLAVVGAHLSGMPLNGQLTSRGSRLWKTARTAGDYKLYALTGTVPAKPGLVRTPGFGGPGIEVEVWFMPECEFGSFVNLVPPPLSIGSCELQNGEVVKGFVCEPHGIAGMPDITNYGGWRNYLIR